MTFGGDPRAWDPYFGPEATRFAGSDVRHTSTSRPLARPDIVGTVHRVRRQIERCLACNGHAYPLDGAPHAPRNDGSDCRGQR